MCKDNEHVWVWIKDWEGDPSIPNGTRDCSHWECAVCGEEYDPDLDGPEPQPGEPNGKA